MGLLINEGGARVLKLVQAGAGEPWEAYLMLTDGDGTTLSPLVGLKENEETGKIHGEPLAGANAEFVNVDGSGRMAP